MLNEVMLQGRLTAAPELKSTQTGKAVSSFTIAVERNYGEAGNRAADFIRCVAWEKTAELASEQPKGQMLIVSGSLQSRSYEKDGEKRTITEVLVSRLYFCGSKSGGSREAPPPPDDDDYYGL